MIDKDKYTNWFNNFCEGFYEDTEEHNRNYKLKIEHTFRVCDNAEIISNSVDIDEYLKDMIWLSSLFHDLGRFPQYRQYRTFKDSISVNHGLLSSKIIHEKDLLKGLSDKSKDIILTTAKFHNAYQIPSEIGDDLTILSLKIVRDADKLDIWKVFTDLYVSENNAKPTAVGLGLPDIPFFSKSVIEAIKRKEIVKLSDVVTINDIKLLQLSWIFDLNFKESYKIFQDRQYIEAFTKTMNVDKEIEECIEIIKDFISNCL